jgi:predicted Fe-S protein YdhL (DUF1289 family)
MLEIPRSTVQSPCLKLCTLDATGRTCLGCGRTTAEIAGWSRMDDAARQAVLDRIAASILSRRRSMRRRSRDDDAV